MVKTVLGLINGNDLGYTQSHEHIWINGPLPETCADKPLNDYEKSLSELKDYYLAGGRAIVDCQPPGAHGDLKQLKKLSEASGVHIIGSTGFHREQFYGKYEEKTVQELEGQFTSEIEDGAGVIKTAVECDGISDYIRTLHEAAARTAVKCGVPVIMHVEKDCDLDALIDFYEAYGLPPYRLILCHCDRKIADLNLHRKALARGVYLEYDTISRPKYHDNEKEIAIIKAMSSEYPEQILLGQDSTYDRLGRYGGNTPLTYILKDFIPAMLERGIPKNVIYQMMINNPANAFVVEK